MIDEQKTVAEPKVEQERQRGDRGEVGTTTAALTIRQMYHAAHFVKQDADDRRNPNKKKWVKNHRAPSLKQFARSLLTQKDPVAIEWMANKHGANNQVKSDVRLALIRATASATHLERRKSSGKSK